MGMQKRRVVTSWPISWFWVFLSVATSILATYSFLQADWVIKRNLVITNYYQPPENNTRTNPYLALSHTSKVPVPIPASPLNVDLDSHSESDSAPEEDSVTHEHGQKTHNSHNMDSKLDHYPKSQYELYKSSKFASKTRLNSNSNVSVNSPSTSPSHPSPDGLYENYGQYNYNHNYNYNYNYNAAESKAGLHVRRVIKVTRVVTTIRFGTIGVCSNTNSNSIVQCQLYTVHDPFPVSSIWSMVTIIGGSGCMTLCVCAVLSLLAVALPSSQLRHQVATTIGYAQTVAVVLLFMSLLLFPLGFDSGFVHYHCGSFAGPYNIGDCEIGWAYALVLVCASLALYCPVLVKFTADIRYDTLPKYL